MESLKQWADPELAAVLERTRPSIEIRSLHNMINRYLAVTMPQEARIATGGNTHIIVYLERHRTGTSSSTTSSSASPSPDPPHRACWA